MYYVGRHVPVETSRNLYLQHIHVVTNVSIVDRTCVYLLLLPLYYVADMYMYIHVLQTCTCIVVGNQMHPEHTPTYNPL